MSNKIIGFVKRSEFCCTAGWLRVGECGFAERSETLRLRVVKVAEIKVFNLLSN